MARGRGWCNVSPSHLPCPLEADGPVQPLAQPDRHLQRPPPGSGSSAARGLVHGWRHQRSPTTLSAQSNGDADWTVGVIAMDDGPDLVRGYPISQAMAEQVCP